MSDRELWLDKIRIHVKRASRLGVVAEPAIRNITFRMQALACACPLRSTSTFAIGAGSYTSSWILGLLMAATGGDSRRN